MYDKTLLNALANSEDVLAVTPILPVYNLNYDAQWIIQSGDYSGKGTPIWDCGLTGEGITVAVGDSGLDFNSCYFSDSSVRVKFSKTETIQGKGRPVYENLSHRKLVQYVAYSDKQEGEDGGHGTHVAGSVAGNNLGSSKQHNGMAYDAKLAFFDIGTPGGYRLDVPDSLFDDMFPFAKRVGSNIHSNSWGGDANKNDQNTIDIDYYSFKNQDFLVLVAAGNAGDGAGTLCTPASSKNCIAVGAMENESEGTGLTTFSSRGPAFDG